MIETMQNMHNYLHNKNTLYYTLSGDYYQTMQDAFQSVEEQSDITDQTNLTSWDVQVCNVC